MIWSLVSKELRQHGLVVVVLGLVTAAGAVVVNLAMSLKGMGGGAFFGLGFAMVTILPLSCLILGHRLVAVEFRQKTQLFLEALPISRWKLIGVKFSFGLVCALCYGVGTLLLTWWLADPGEGKTERFLQILAARTGLWAACVYSFFFMMGFLGRYRIPIFLVLFFGVQSVSEGTAIAVGDFPPFQLIDMQTFGFERDDFPVSDLWWSGAIVAGLTAMSFVLGIVREGSVASMMGERMSHKEKMVLGCLVVGVIFGMTTWSMKNPDPFVLPDAVKESRGEVVVSVASPQGRPADEEVQLAALLADEMAAAKDWCGAASWPEVFVVEREDDFEEESLFRQGDLEDVPGVLIYADYRSEAFSEARFVRFVLGSCLEELSQGRVNREGKKWVYLGLVRMWGDRERFDEPIGAWEQRATKARMAVGQAGLDERQLEQWLSFEKEVGEGKAKAVAWAGLKVMGQRHGEAKVRELLALVLGRRVEMDLRETIYDLRHPVPKLFEEVTGERFSEFVAAWEAAIRGEEGGAE